MPSSSRKPKNAVSPEPRQYLQLDRIQKDDKIYLAYDSTIDPTGTWAASVKKRMTCDCSAYRTLRRDPKQLGRQVYRDPHVGLRSGHFASNPRDLNRGAVFHPMGIRSPPNGDQGLRTLEELIDIQHGKYIKPISVISLPVLSLEYAPGTPLSLETAKARYWRNETALRRLYGRLNPHDGVAETVGLDGLTHDDSASSVGDTSREGSTELEQATIGVSGYSDTVDGAAGDVADGRGEVIGGGAEGGAVAAPTVMASLESAGVGNTEMGMKKDESTDASCRSRSPSIESDAVSTQRAAAARATTRSSATLPTSDTVSTRASAGDSEQKSSVDEAGSSSARTQVRQAIPTSNPLRLPPTPLRSIARAPPSIGLPPSPAQSTYSYAPPTPSSLAFIPKRGQKRPATPITPEAPKRFARYEPVVRPRPARDEKVAARLDGHAQSSRAQAGHGLAGTLDNRGWETLLQPGRGALMPDFLGSFPTVFLSSDVPLNLALELAERHSKIESFPYRAQILVTGCRTRLTTAPEHERYLEYNGGMIEDHAAELEGLRQSVWGSVVNLAWSERALELGYFPDAASYKVSASR